MGGPDVDMEPDPRVSDELLAEYYTEQLHGRYFDSPDTEDTSQGEDARRPFLGTVLKRSQLGRMPKVQPLIEGVLSTPGVAVFVGGYGVGKTFVALSWAACVGTGREWLGREVEQRRTLYVLGEGVSGLDDRLTAWEEAWGGKISDDELSFVVRPDSLRKSGAWLELERLAIDGGYRFIVLDTFSSLAPDLDETKDAAMFTRRMSDLAAAIDGTVLLVHHPGWSDGDRTRGGYQFEANPDEVLVAKELDKGSAGFTLKRKKVKDGQAGQVLYLRRKIFGQSCVIEETREDLASMTMIDKIAVVLDNVGEVGATGRQIMEELGVSGSRSTFYKALNKMRDEGRVREEVAGRLRTYFLNETDS